MCPDTASPSPTPEAVTSRCAIGRGGFIVPGNRRGPPSVRGSGGENTSATNVRAITSTTAHSAHAAAHTSGYRPAPRHDRRTGARAKWLVCECVVVMAMSFERQDQSVMIPQATRSPALPVRRVLSVADDEFGVYWSDAVPVGTFPKLSGPAWRTIARPMRSSGSTRSVVNLSRAVPPACTRGLGRSPA